MPGNLELRYGLRNDRIGLSNALPWTQNRMLRLHSLQIRQNP
jgi:hypothetical protein